MRFMGRARLRPKVGFGGQPSPLCAEGWLANRSREAAKVGGRGWIRTTVGVSQRVYSASPLAARAPVREAALYRLPGRLLKRASEAGTDGLWPLNDRPCANP